MRLFKNGRIAREETPDLLDADVLVDGDGMIFRVGPGIVAEEGVETVDCSGCILVPGMFDLHVHAREPGDEDKETIATCAEAARHGGVTGVVLMPDTSPPIDSGNLVKSVQDIVSETSSITMMQSGCLTRGREGKELAGFSGMVARGVPMLTDSGRSVSCANLLRRCMEYAKDFDVLVTSFCDTPSLTRLGVINEGEASYRLGLPGIPAVSQEIAIARDLCLARYTGVRLHVQQVSTRRGLNAIARAKEDGVAVTCEVSPHHLVLNENDVGDYDTSTKLDPPLQPSSDCEALVAGLADGSIDAIATNHSPHTEFEKSAEFASAPPGVAGLETGVLVLHDRFVRNGVFGWDVLIRSYSSRPREIVGLEPVSIREGKRAEFFVFDPEGETTITADYLRTKSPATPFLNQTLAGTIRETVFVLG
ncbi:MAG: dihydroorotase [Verrucomicrobiales bacterium]